MRLVHDVDHPCGYLASDRDESLTDPEERDDVTCPACLAMMGR